MEGRQRRSFTDDYKRQAVDLVPSSARSIGSVAKELGLRDSGETIGSFARCEIRHYVHCRSVGKPKRPPQWRRPLAGALYNYMVMSGIEAIPTTRLYEIWFEQKWGTHLALRAGQLAADYEFMTAKYTWRLHQRVAWLERGSCVEPSKRWGPHRRWPPWMLVSARTISQNLTLLGAVFDGKAAGPGLADPQSTSGGLGRI